MAHKKSLDEITNELSQHSIAKAFRNNSLNIANLTRKEIIDTQEQKGYASYTDMNNILSKNTLKLMAKNNKIYKKWNQQLAYHGIKFEIIEKNENEKLYTNLVSKLATYNLTNYAYTPMNQVHNLLDEFKIDNEFLQQNVNNPYGLTDEVKAEVSNAIEVNNDYISVLHYLSTAMNNETRYLETMHMQEK